jgi:hypothetical protein
VEGASRGQPAPLVRLVVGLDDSKRVSVVTTQKILEFLGDFGGFKEAVNIVFSIFGYYFSSRLFKADLVRKLFKEEVLKDKGDQDFNLSGFHVIFEPVVATLVQTFSCSSFCRNLRISKN